MTIPGIILAAGEGQRLLPLTESLPKTLLPLNAGYEGTLHYLLKGFKRWGITPQYVIGGHLYELLESEIQLLRRQYIALTLVDARPTYLRGPLFSFLSIPPSLAQEPLMAVVPGDTFFTSRWFDWLKSQTFTPSTIHLFTPSDFEPLEFGSNMTKWILPLLIVPGSFLTYCHTHRTSGATKIIDIVRIYLQENNSYQIHRIPPDLPLPVDLDTLDRYTYLQGHLPELWFPNDEGA
jgi:molybdopterin-guanine dinucleotide biosynthesis protein A